MSDINLNAAARVARTSPRPAKDHVVEVTDATFDDFLAKATTPVFMEFYNPT